jgi:hypothetical protein
MALALAVAPMAMAEKFVIESRSGGTNFAAYAEVGGNWLNSSVKSGADDMTGGIGSRFATQDGSAFTVIPTLQEGQTYSVEVTHPTSSNIPTDLMVGIAQVGCTGLPADTPEFNQTPANVWRLIGNITVDIGVTTPTITFTKLPGSSGTGQRFYADGVRFINLSDPCLTALPAIPTVNGPLAAGQTFVDVPAVDVTAIAVTVYAGDTQIGQLTSGIVAGVNRVTTTPLVKGQIITATQTNPSAVESCRSSTGPVVGGGANPRIRIALSIREDESLAGPIGADGGTSTLALYFLGATNVTSGFGTAPTYGRLVQPSNDWQVVTFLRGNDPASPTDPTYLWSGTSDSSLRGDFGIFDSIALAIDDLADSGPFALYIDNVVNGSTVFQDFESATNGEPGVLFREPGAATVPSGYLLAQPNVSVVTNATGDTSLQSAFISWQFKDTARADWVRLLLQGTGTPNPQVDLREPISFRILLLPVDSSITPQPPSFFTHPSNQTVLQGGSITLRVAARGAFPLSYQWRFNGNDLPDATNSVLQLTNAQPSLNGGYSVFISNSLGTATSSTGVLTVVAAPLTQVATLLWQIPPGSRPYVTADNTQRGLAYNPTTGNLLLVSRTPTNAIHVLEGDTGDHLFTLNTDTNIIRGGTIALNMVGVTEDGYIYACNVTGNGTTSEFKIYQWTAEDPVTPPTLVWHGDPGLKLDTTRLTNRWGDTFAVRGSSIDPKIMVGARAGRAVSTFVLPLGDTSQPFPYEIPDANNGNFGFGLAWGEGDTIWAKGAGAAPLRLIQLNPDFTGTILHTFAAHPTLRALGYDPARRFLAAVSLENPDNLRLFDAFNPSVGLPNIDTDFFPRDNPNGNGTGAIAFGNNRVYALDSNNGIIAMELRPYLAFSRQGNQLEFRWSNGTLESSATIDGTFSEVLGATSPWPVDASAGTRFYRVRR